MTKQHEIYKCKICGNIVQVLIEGAGDLVCCSQNMELLKPQKDTSELGEKHAVKIKNSDINRIAYINSHPMTKEHYIQFIEALDFDRKEVHIKYFNTDNKPEFDITNLSDNLKLQELCNIHELWGE